MPPNGHHARSCTFGTISVNWRNAFTQSGKQQVRQMVTAFARITAFPYEKDQALITRFQQLSLVNAEAAIDSLEALQLVTVLNAFLESIKRPYCSRRSLIDALTHFSPDNPTVLPPESDQEEENNLNSRMDEEVELVKMLMNPVATSSEIGAKTTTMATNECQTPMKVDDENTQQSDNGSSAEVGNGTVEEGGQKTEERQENEAQKQNGAVQKGHQTPPTFEQQGEDTKEQNVEPVAQIAANDALQYDQKQSPPTVVVDEEEQSQCNPTDCAKNYGGISIENLERQNDDGDGSGNAIGEQQQETENDQSTSPNDQAQNAHENDPLANDDDHFSTLLPAFDNHDSHTNKLANLNADWQCVVFYICNVISFLTGENYDTMVDLLTFWFFGDNNRDVKQAVYCHMRDLFARNMRQQEQQAAEWRRRMGMA